jgi:hypothetical protein
MFTDEIPLQKHRIEESLQPVFDTCRRLEQSVAAIPAAGAKPEDLQKLVADQVNVGLATIREHDAQAAEAQAAQQRIAEARSKFLSEKAAKIPATYHQLIPVTDDAAQLEAGLTAAIDAVKKDVGSMGLTFPGLGASAGGDGKDNQAAAVAAAAAEASRRNPAQGLADLYRNEIKK